jgi:hypothetical protein
MRPVLVLPLLLIAIAPVCAVEGAGGDRIPWLSADTTPRLLPPLPDGGLPETSVVSRWSRKGVIGVFLSNTTTARAEESRDATIAGTTGATSVSGKIDAGLEWRSGKNSTENLLKAVYGRIRQQDQEWVENKDEVRYDGVFRRVLERPSFLYLSWGCETVFTGPEPERDTFDPFLVKGAAGYGQLYEDMLPEKDRFEWRIGARIQKSWGSSLDHVEDNVETGPELFARYERQAIIKRDDQDLRYFAQFEAFSEFNDIRHLTSVITAGLTYQLTRFLTIDLAMRAYYEMRPKEDRDDHLEAGYDQWSLRQDVLLGLAYTF